MGYLLEGTWFKATADANATADALNLFLYLLVCI